MWPKNFVVQQGISSKSKNMSLGSCNPVEMKIKYNKLSYLNFPQIIKSFCQVKNLKISENFSKNKVILKYPLLKWHYTVKIPFFMRYQFFVVFVGRQNNEIWFPTKSRTPLVCLLKTSKPQIQESMNLCFIPKPCKLVSMN